MAIARHVSPFNDASPSAQAAPQALTKRDVRRNRIVEKLQNMVQAFSANGHHHYRAQLQAIQVDMTLLVGADPYRTGGPLEDGHDEIRAMVDNIVQANMNGVGGVNLPEDEAARNDFYSIAGKRYGEFVRSVNDSIEQRDTDLTALHNNYNNAVAELERTYQQRLRQAEEEHKALSATIRQRLTTSLSKKRAQLLRDKDQLDIADSNAMLMHPNHFSIGNTPGSPSHSNALNNKRTRHLRHHRGASPAPNSVDIDNGKRKRKFGQLDDDTILGYDPLSAFAGGRSPQKDSQALREYAQFEAPAYSIDKIFTDKELAMATDTAKLATYKYFYLPQQAPQEHANGNGTLQSSIDGETGEAGEGAGDDNVGDVLGPNSPAPAAPEMERTTSHQVLTRGGARKDPLAALADLAAAAASSSGPAPRPNTFTPAAPTYHAVTRSEKSGAPAPPGVSAIDIESDFEMIRRVGGDMQDDSDRDVPMSGNPVTAASEEAVEMRRQLLDQALGRSTVHAPYRLPQLETGPGAMIGPSVEREPRTGFAPLLPIAVHFESRGRGGAASMAAALSGRLGLGAEPMSRTTSAGGASEVGDTAATTAPTSVGRRGGKGKLV